MKGRPVDQLIYEYMFPKPRQTDPQNFQQLLTRNLVLEVRQEVHSYYGHLDTPEAKYPGLDYTNHIHRIRLSRWQWHRRLFRAFDGLRLTYSEIQNLTKWEGTKWAKERFEREQGIVIRDTTADDFPNYVEPENRTPAYLRTTSEQKQDLNANEEDDEEEDEEESDEEELESVGEALNERLRERVALRNISGDSSVPLDEDWENWLKNAIESGAIPHVFSRSRSTLSPNDIFTEPMMAAARAGRWDVIPDVLHDRIRMTLETELRPVPQTPSSAQATTSAPRPTIRYENIGSGTTRLGLGTNGRHVRPLWDRPRQAAQQDA
ncbi:hypothetical protein QBC38DRAFT_198175 [Podospora fimiseda]|uniref:Uncharacterized protein n=1 Tax=Podospora fimiseda TaxID=252190 RepID=A0AAN7BPR6_9PEZI|nr:hypothetical protein QBC38DRAFT_198175 [Podospora fimiseda]